MNEERYEAVILVRIDDMSTYSTVGQRSIRFEVEVASPPGEDLNVVVQRALDNAPPIADWQGF